MSARAEWGEKGIPVMDVVRGPGTVKGAPWPAVVSLGNLFFFEGGKGNSNLRCIPLEGDNTLDSSDVGAVDFDMIEPELAECSAKVADLLRSLCELEASGVA